MFLGTHTPRLDDKGRIFLPAKFREGFTEGIVLTAGQERCIYVWPSAEFRTYSAQLRSNPGDTKSARAFNRMVYSSATNEQADKQGRVTLPSALRSYAGLERDCVVIGADTRVEIWDAQAWESYRAEHEQAFADWSEEVVGAVT